MLHDYSEYPVLFDFETQSCADLPEIGGRLYAECPSTRVLSLSCLIDRELHIWIPKNVAAPYRGELYLPPEYRPLYDTLTLHQTETLPEPIEKATQTRVFAAHNLCGFDRFIWEECVAKRGLGSLPTRWADTLYLARLAGLPRGGLDAVAEQLLGTSKDAAKKIVMPLTRGEWVNGEPEYPRVQSGMIDPLVRYCSVDTLILAQLWEKFSDLIVESDAIQAHQNINDRGIAVDLSLSTRLVIVAAEASRRAAEEIEILTRPDRKDTEPLKDGEQPRGELYGDTATRKGNLRSTDKVHAWLKKQGVEIVMEVAGETGTVRKKTLRKDVVEQYLANPLLMLGEDTEVSLEVLKNFNADVLPLVTKVLRLRVTATRITSAKAEKMGKRACADGRIYDLHTYHKAHCVSGDTEVLTVHGWERIDSWQGGPIAQWYPNGTIVFETADNNVFTTNEPTLTLDSPYLSGVFTLGHTVPGYTQAGLFRPMKAEDVAKQNRRMLPISGNLRHEGSITADQMRVLVAIQADGHWCTDSKQGRGLQLAVKRERKILRAREILTKAGVTYRENTFPSCPDTVRFSIRWDDCPSWLTPERKVFGSWVMDSTNEARHAMIEEMQLWDGSQANPQGNASYASKLDVNHEWMSIIAHLTGKSMLQRSMQSMLRNSATAGVKKEHWTSTPALDKVYCPTTKTGYWIYRHKGKIGITGNTGRASSQGVQIHNMPRGKKGVKVGKLLQAHENGEWSRDAAKAYDFIYSECLDPVERQKGLTVDDALSSLIRPCFLAAKGHKLGIADYAAIECRGIAWIAGEEKLLDAFAAGRDVYCEFASILYGKTVTKDMKVERQVGKTVILGCIAEGTEVLTEVRGWIPIESVSLCDRVWDGSAFVVHGGVVAKGTKECINYQGVWLTPDHKILTDSGWVESCQLNASTHYPLSGRYTENGRLLISRMVNGAESLNSSANAVAGELYPNTQTISVVGNPLDATRAESLSEQRQKLSIPLNWTFTTGNDYLTAYPQYSVVAPIPNPASIIAMAEGELLSTPSGWRIDNCSSITYLPYPDGMTPNSKLTESRTEGITNPETFDSQPVKNKCETRKLTTYDILNCGPNNRFQAGKLIVHNCGYGMGVEKFAMTAALQNIDLKKAGTSAEQCVETYRAAYQKIAGSYSGSVNGRAARRGGIWEQLNTAAMRAVVEGGRHTAGKCHFVYAGGVLRVTLPSGRELRYNNCRVEDRVPSYAIALGLDVKARPTIVYVGERGETSMYGGKWAENLVQAICRDILYTALIRGEMFGVPFVADVHDETIGEYPEAVAAEYLQKQCILMSHPPEWAAGFPIAVEGYTSRRYVKEAAIGEYQVTAINGVVTHAEYKA